MGLQTLVCSAVLSVVFVSTACFATDTAKIPAEAQTAVVAPSGSASASTPDMVVYKSPTCGCCQGWVEYLDRAGLKIKAVNVNDMDAIKQQHGLTNPALKSCHTAVIDGYVIEGHVPVSDIERLLKERPNVVGITAPGMPQLSPGMASEIPKNYDVLTFDKNGDSEVFSSY